MTKTFTQEDLIRYLYRETSEEETRQLDFQLTIDAELRSQLDEIRELMSCLDRAMLTPSAAATRQIWGSIGLSSI